MGVEVRYDQKFTKAYQNKDQDGIISNDYAVIKLNRRVQREKYLDITPNFSDKNGLVNVFGFP